MDINIKNKLSKLRKEDRDLAKTSCYTEKDGNEWYTVRHMLSYANWAMFYILLGGREAGKSYSVTDFFCRQFKNKGIPFT